MQRGRGARRAGPGVGSARQGEGQFLDGEQGGDVEFQALPAGHDGLHPAHRGLGRRVGAPPAEFASCRRWPAPPRARAGSPARRGRTRPGRAGRGPARPASAGWPGTSAGPPDPSARRPRRGPPWPRPCRWSPRRTPCAAPRAPATFSSSVTAAASSSAAFTSAAAARRGRPGRSATAGTGAPRRGAAAPPRRWPAGGPGRCAPARPGRRPAPAAGSTPSRRASTSATAADGGVRSVTSRHRDRIVVTRSSADGAHSSHTVRGGGSSIALSRALAPARWPGRRPRTARPASGPPDGAPRPRSTRSRVCLTP